MVVDYFCDLLFEFVDVVEEFVLFGEQAEAFLLGGGVVGLKLLVFTGEHVQLGLEGIIEGELLEVFVR